MDFFTRLFDPTGFPARWQCGSGWQDTPWLGWLHIISDLGIWAAYAAIPFVLVYFLKRRPDLPFKMIFLLFGAFILACGTTHLIDVILFWHPIYRFAGIVKVFTAIVSWGTVFALIRIFPAAIKMRSPNELEQEIQARTKQVHDNAGRLESVVNHVVDGIISINERGTVETFNPAAEKIFGYTAAEVVGNNVRMLMPDPYRSGHDNFLANYLRTGQAKIIGIGREVSGQRKDGSTFPLELAVSEFFIGPKRFFTGIVRDITEKKKMEQEIQEHTLQLKEADRFKNEFLAMLAHELRNPLGPLRNGLRILRIAKNDEAEVEKTRLMMDRQLGQLVHLIEDLLDISRISRGKLELRKTVVVINKQIENSLETIRQYVEGQKHELTVNIPNEQLLVNGDPTRLAQIITNLLHNAAKFTPKGGHIWLTVYHENKEVIISVKDNGVGISPDLLPRMFEMFTQADRTVERSQGGLGIGLSLVKKLTELHGGTVAAYSGGVGCGCEFIVRLPSAKGAVTLDSKEFEVFTQGNRILVVDDNVDAADSNAKLLKMAGNEVITVYDGIEAVEAARQHKPNVILLDLGLPKMNGYDVCRAIRKQPAGKTAIIVAMTGWGQDETRQRSKEAGFDAHLVKPVEVNDLTKIITDLKRERGI